MLTPKKKLFCERYLASGFNALRAAREAGYSAHTAGSQGSRLLKDVDVQKYLAAHVAKAKGNNEAESARVLKNIDRIANSDLRRLFGEDGKPLAAHELPEDIALALSSFELTSERMLDQDGNQVGERTKFRPVLWNKVKALEMQARIAKLLDGDGTGGAKSPVTVVINNCPAPGGAEED